MAGVISIDGAAVGAFAAQIRSVAGELASVRADFETADTGAAEINEALTDFHGDWSQKREKILEGLQGAADALDHIVEQFEAADASMVDAVDGA